MTEEELEKYILKYGNIGYGGGGNHELQISKYRFWKFLEDFTKEYDIVKKEK